MFIIAHSLFGWGVQIFDFLAIERKNLMLAERVVSEDDNMIFRKFVLHKIRDKT
jgi:hypothetical protein